MKIDVLPNIKKVTEYPGLLRKTLEKLVIFTNSNKNPSMSIRIMQKLPKLSEEAIGTLNPLEKFLYLRLSAKKKKRHDGSV